MKKFITSIPGLTYQRYQCNLERFEDLYCTMTILFHRNKKRAYDQWSNMCYFLIYEATCLYCFVLMFCFRIENNYFHSEIRIFKCMCFAI